MATGFANPRGIEHCAHGEAVVRSLQNGRIVIVVHERSHQTWSVHKTLVESECQIDLLEEDIFEDYCMLGSEHDPATFDLFVQWLYTRKYQEMEGVVESLALAKSELERVTLEDLDFEPEGIPDGMMSWAAKAAILCWELGASLGAKGFQNYAMERLFEALSRPLAQPLTANLILHTYDVANDGAYHGTSPLQRLIQDVIVRNWGDDTIVQHGDQETWSDTLEACHHFRMIFIKAMSKTLEKRREQELSLEDYLVH